MIPSTGSPPPTHLGMKRKSLSARQLPLELNACQMFFPQSLLHENNLYTSSLLKFFALHLMPNIFRILLTVTLEFGYLDYYQGEI